MQDRFPRKPLSSFGVLGGDDAAIFWAFGGINTYSLLMDDKGQKLLGGNLECTLLRIHLAIVLAVMTEDLGQSSLMVIPGAGSDDHVIDFFAHHVVEDLSHCLLICCSDILENVALSM